MSQVANIFTQDWTQLGQTVSSMVRRVKAGFHGAGGQGKGLMSHEASDETNPCAEPGSVLSAVQGQEVAILKYWYCLVDPRPDPGVYRNADADGAARDVVELNIMVTFVDPRGFTSPWVPYDQEEDLFEEQ